mgnify:CR=1 FL=1
MRICGFNKTTLLDYPGKVASTIFLGGCNFRCPFCQNGILVVAPGEQPDYSQEELLTFLKKRKGILDGVCISGGEPTLSDGLEEFLGKIKELGYAVKLDTNGSRPKIVKHLAEAGLIDKVAMDIKACPDNYGNLTGIEKPDMDSIFETADFLLHGNLDYEFRTTVVRELHTQKDFEEIAGWLAGAKEYYLQAYKDSDGVLRPGYGSYTFENAYAGLLFGVLSAMIASCIFAVFVLIFKSTPVIVGIALNLAAWGGTTYLLSMIFKTRGVFIDPQIKSFGSIDIPLIKDIPYIGKFLSGQNILVYLSLVFMIIAYIIMFKTPSSRCGYQKDRSADRRRQRDQVSVYCNSDWRYAVRLRRLVPDHRRLLHVYGKHLRR